MESKMAADNDGELAPLAHRDVVGVRIEHEDHPQAENATTRVWDSTDGEHWRAVHNQPIQIEMQIVHIEPGQPEARPAMFELEYTPGVRMVKPPPIRGMAKDDGDGVD